MLDNFDDDFPIAKKLYFKLDCTDTKLSLCSQSGHLLLLY